MNRTIVAFIALSFLSSAFASSLESKTAYSKASGYTGMKKSLLYQALGSRKVFRRLV